MNYFVLIEVIFFLQKVWEGCNIKWQRASAIISIQVLTDHIVWCLLLVPSDFNAKLPAEGTIYLA